MTSSHFAYYRDQLHAYDRKAEEVERQINELYAQLARLREGRLQTQRLMEEIFGQPESTVVMQNMKLAAAPQQSTPQLSHADDGELSRLHKYGGLDDKAAKKKERDHRSYLKRKAKQKAGKQRVFKPKPGAWSTRIIAFLQGAEEPIGFADLVRHHGAGKETALVRNAISSLKRRGFIVNTTGKSGTGNHYAYEATPAGLAWINGMPE